MKTGRAGRDKRGLWIRDELTGTQARLGNISPELALEFSKAGNRREMLNVMKKPVFGVWVSKTF